MTHELKKALHDAGKKIFSLCSPWPLWTISGCYIADAPTGAGRITETDIGGKEILSFVPLPYIADFLSPAGQSMVSNLEPYYTLYILTYDSNDPRSLKL